MGEKETIKGGKKIIHRKKFVDKGLLYQGKVYPIFKKQQTRKSWTFVESLSKANKKKENVGDLEKQLADVEDDRQREMIY